MILCFGIVSVLSLSSQAEEAGKRLGSATQVVYPTVIENVSAEKAQILLKGEKAPVVIDLRTPKEFKKGHLAGAIMIDFKSTDFQEQLAELDRRQSYLFYCKSGVRSKKSYTIWKELGFQQLFHLDSGIRGWQKSGGKTVAGQ